MAKAKDKDVIDAKVVDVASNIGPIDSIVVGDKRDNFGKRLGLFAIVILLLFFAISSYVSSAQNQSLLNKAAVTRDKLVDSNNKTVNSLNRLVQNNQRQAHQINRLQNALHKQNKLLRAHGLKTIVIPRTDNYSPPPTTTPNQPNHHKKHHRHKKNHHKGNHGPNGPKPNPSPTDSPVKRQLCNTAGVCIKPMERTNHDYDQKALRHAKVYCSSVVASDWRSIFCDLADLGSTKRK